MTIVNATISGAFLRPDLGQGAMTVYLEAATEGSRLTSGGSVIAGKYPVWLASDGTATATVPQLPQAGVLPSDARWRLVMIIGNRVYTKEFTLTADTTWGAIIDVSGTPITSSILSACLDAQHAAEAAAAAAPGAQALRPLRAACIGTSIWAGGLRTCDGTTVVSGGGWNAANMDRYMQGPGGQSWFTWLCLYSGGRIMHHYNGSEASSDSDSWVSGRFQAQVLAKKPDIVFIGDATNDINNGFTDSHIRTNVQTLVAQAISAKVIPVLAATSPQSDATKNQSGRRHNEWLMRYAWANGFTFIHPWLDNIDPASTTGFPLAGTTSDGLHPNETGAQLAGKCALDQMAGLIPGPIAPMDIPWVTQERVNDMNLLLNPLFQDDVNIDLVADNWSVSAGGGRTLATRADVKGKLQGVTVNGANQSIGRDTSVPGSGISVGDRVALSGLVEVTSTSSLQWKVGLTCLGQAGNWASLMPGYTGGGPVGVGITLTPFYCELTVPTGCTIVRAQLLGQSGTGTLAAAQWKLVNLTVLGLDSLF